MILRKESSSIPDWHDRLKWFMRGSIECGLSGLDRVSVPAMPLFGPAVALKQRLTLNSRNV